MTHVPDSTHDRLPHVNCAVGETLLVLQRFVSVLMQTPELSQRPVVLPEKRLHTLLAKPLESAEQTIASGPPHATLTSAEHVPSEPARLQRQHSPPKSSVIVKSNGGRRRSSFAVGLSWKKKAM